MVMSPFEAATTDSGLFAAVLGGSEFYDWCAVQTTARWALPAVRCAHVALRSALRRSRRCQASIWELAQLGDVTALWALLAEDAPLLQPSGELLRESTLGNTLLHLALSGRGPSELRLVRWLLSRPGALAAARCRNVRGQTPLHLCAIAGFREAVEAILSLPDIEVDARDSYQATPLVLAVREEYPALVQALLAARSDPNTFVPNCHGHGDTPLVLAVRLKNVEIVKQVVAAPGVDLHQNTLLGVPFGKEAMDFAPQKGEIRRVLEEAVAKAAHSRETALQQDDPGAAPGTAAGAAAPGANFKAAVEDPPAAAAAQEALVEVTPEKLSFLAWLLRGCSWCNG